eukprot:TRINITY_DN27327_c0_g1_i1.p1 TRINITY_DN27327_c0_g1~~TRINITY_DN27327_c0_g1_i1.p1  ORF type:complete len:303 (+),score=52.55 TRINITY_DN27327_c0_g1_i1:28-936(+)
MLFTRMGNFGVIRLCVLLQIATGFLCEECIDSPGSYQDVFENVVETGSEISCVARELMCSIIGPYSHEGGDCPLNEDLKPDFISAGGNSSYWAWVSASHNLDIYLQIAQENAGNRFEVAAEMMRFVGFTEEYIDPACSYSLAVFNREELEGLFAPTWASLFLQLEGHPFNVSLDWDVSRKLALEGFYNFTGISGCAGTVVDDTCLPEYRETYNILASVLAEAGSVPCVQEFRDMFNNGETATVSQARAFVHGCFDANPLFTGLGYGYSAATSQLTEREYLARNSNLDSIGAAYFSLYSPQLD